MTHEIVGLKTKTIDEIHNKSQQLFAVVGVLTNNPHVGHTTISSIKIHNKTQQIPVQHLAVQGSVDQ